MKLLFPPITKIITYCPKLRNVSLSTEFDSNAHSATSIQAGHLEELLNLSEPVSLLYNTL